MNYLRKHSKVILVVMGIVCMITFVVGAALSDLATSARQRADNPNPVVVTWAKGKVHAAEMENLRFRHARVIEFLQRVIVTAMERGGKPTINGRPVTLDRNFDVGIPMNGDEQSMMQIMVLAAEGDRMGVTVDTSAAKDYLRQISSPELREADWLEIATSVIGENNRLSVNQLLEHLALELKAHHVRMLGVAGFHAHGVGPIVPPGQAYDLFCRLNRRFAIEAYPVETEQFVSQVKGQPTEVEVQKLFDEGKNRDPNPNLDEPGFRKPRKLAFKWLKVDFKPFLDEAKKQITEEQIEEAYQKDISQGLHKVLDLPKETPGVEEKKDGEKSDAEPAEPAQDAQPAADKPAEDKPAEGKPAAKAPESKADEKPAANPENAGDCGQEEQPQPAEKSTPDAPQAEGKPAETKPADAKPAEEKPAAAEADKPATTPPGDTSAATPPAEAKYKPLSEVREEILTRLAQPIAEEARKKAVGEIVSAIEKYGKAYRRYQDVKSVRKNTDLKEPEKLDLAPLAAKHNFPIGETPLVDQFEVQKLEIGQKVQQFDMAAAQMGQFRMLSFAEMTFGQDQPLYRPEEARSSEPDVSYIYFRTAEEKDADVTLKEAREQVVAFWKQRQAFDLALAEAKKLAEKAKSAESLASAVPDATKVVTTPPFSWMTTGGFGFGQPELSQVPGIELAGREFMQSVFMLSPGETGAAPNQSHAKVYVVKVLTQDPEEEKLREQFLESGYNQMVLLLAQGEAVQTSVDWYRGIADRYQVKWQRPPRDERRM
jgi:hypothetical protein